MSKVSANSKKSSSKKRKVVKKASLLSSDELYDSIKLDKRERLKKKSKKEDILEDEFVKKILSGEYKTFADIDKITRTEEDDNSKEEIIKEEPIVEEEVEDIIEKIEEDEKDTIITSVIDISEVEKMMNTNDSSLDELDTIIEVNKKRGFFRRFVDKFKKN
jgi:NCAIR mutase (PurE)-related protein